MEICYLFTLIWSVVNFGKLEKGGQCNEKIIVAKLLLTIGLKLIDDTKLTTAFCLRCYVTLQPIFDYGNQSSSYYKISP